MFQICVKKYSIIYPKRKSKETKSHYAILDRVERSFKHFVFFLLLEKYVRVHAGVKNI